MNVERKETDPPSNLPMFPYVKYISLAVLVVQTTASVLVLRYSRTVKVNGPRYLPSTTVVISEMIKIITCVIVLYFKCGSFKCLAKFMHREVWSKPKETLKVFIPAGLFTIQNNLLFLALSNLDAATYQVTYQLKILTTAMFSVTILHKRLEITQWIALVVLMVGVALVQMPSSQVVINDVEHSISSQFFGLIAVLIACFSSGFGGVYFEKLLKTSPQSLWVRNFQLGMFSVFLALFVCIVQDFGPISRAGFFQGYYTTTWTVIFLQAFGGLVVATVVKYADNILKGFATSVSIVLSTICSYYLLSDFKPTEYFFIGATVVIFATMLYGSPIKIPLLCQLNVARKSEEKSTS